MEEYVREVRRIGIKPIKPSSISTPKGFNREGSKSFGNDFNNTNGAMNRSKSHHPKDRNNKGKGTRNKLV